MFKKSKKNETKSKPDGDKEVEMSSSKERIIDSGPLKEKTKKKTPFWFRLFGRAQQKRKSASVSPSEKGDQHVEKKVGEVEENDQRVEGKEKEVGVEGKEKNEEAKNQEKEVEGVEENDGRIEVEGKEEDLEVEDKEKETEVEGKEKEVEDKEKETEVEGKEEDLEVEDKEKETEVEGKEKEIEVEGKEKDVEAEDKEKETEVEGKEKEVEVEGKEEDLEVEGKEKEIQVEGKEKEVEDKEKETEVEGKEKEIEVEGNKGKPEEDIQEKEDKKKKKKKTKFWRFLCKLFMCFQKPKDEPTTIIVQVPVEAPVEAPVQDPIQLQTEKIIWPNTIQEQVQTCWLGFPNPGQLCYMNSSLQSLLTLPQFIHDINSQEEFGSMNPVAELLSCFKNIKRCRSSEDTKSKLRATLALKKLISRKAPEFIDDDQKDAHEFLTTVIDQIRNLSQPLHQYADFTGSKYKCPVETNMEFLMENTRTCKSCLSESVREESFTNLSLDVVKDISVQDMLHNYQKEEELEYYCDCGSRTSSQQCKFWTLPNILILHLKRFRYTPSFKLVKVHDPVRLCKNLTLSTNQTESTYSLVSVISHIGKGTSSGHYICDGVYSGDQWLNYNDSRVQKTTCAAICDARRKTSYILFYQKQ